MSGGPLPEIRLEPGTKIVADLHLDLGDAERSGEFLGWLAQQKGIPRLVVLGDLFDVWVGPAQERLPVGPVVLDALSDLVRSGTRLEILHGNRDFLLDERFEARTGARIHPRGIVGLTGGSRILLIHGDELCTKDLGYQRLKRVVRSGPVRALSRTLPLPVATSLARKLRRSSVRALSVKLPEEKALQESACRELAALHRARTVVCGHAHRFRDETLADGTRWIVLDAFGGAKDALEVGVSDLLSITCTQSQ
ncbi:MAG: UDP-2,3-diacylglucosamine diphosphatase [Planctomycetota bacterium]